MPRKQINSFAVPTAEDGKSDTVMMIALRPSAALLLLALCASLLASCATYRVPMNRDDFGLHFVRVHVNNYPGVFLVDSGASHTVLDHRFANRCLKNMTPSNLRLAWLGSQHTDTKEGVVDHFQIGSHKEVGPFRIHVLNLDAINNAPARTRAMRMDGIIGADFLITHRALIDYSTSSLRFSSAPNTWMEPPRIKHRR